ncbi:hypothetical protein BJ165DRAFT_1337285 [Panaeolus papilionaceus]|nr:hypothetical protein BJ165DRAFT_1337285 [Panaeolus papilionaceus]
MSPREEPSLKHLDHRVLNRDTFYIPNFITEDEEKYLVQKIIESPQPKWKTLANRRLQIWAGGDITAKGTLIPQPLPKFTDQYPDLISRIKNTGAFDNSPHGQPNHIIMNEYLPGQGIMPHEDGPRYHPVVATLSLLSHTVFHYYQYKERDEGESNGTGRSVDKSAVMSLLLEPRSLVISSGEMYTTHLHGIDSLEEDIVTVDLSNNPSAVSLSNFNQLADQELKMSIERMEPLKRSVRYSLTCRDVARVSSFHRQ